MDLVKQPMNEINLVVTPNKKLIIKIKKNEYEDLVF